MRGWKENECVLQEKHKAPTKVRSIYRPLDIRHTVIAVVGLPESVDVKLGF
jgi:hypothetical protein